MDKHYSSELMRILKEEDANGDAKIERLFNLLSLAVKERKIGKKEFQALSNFINNIDETKPHILFKKVTRNAGTQKSLKTLSVSAAIMGITPDIFPDSKDITDLDSNLISPSVVTFTASPIHCVKTSKIFPLSFSNYHVVERFTERAKEEELEYDSADAVRGFFFNLALIYSISPLLIQKNIKSTPLVLPHENGFFLGHTEACSAVIFADFIEQSAKVNGRFNREAGPISPQISKAWNPNYRTYINTFIDTSLFFDTQKKLHHSILALISDPETNQGMVKIAKGYFDHTNGCDENDPSVIAFRDSVLSLFQSPIWVQGVQAGFKHIPDETYEEKFVRQLDKKLTSQLSDQNVEPR